MEAAAKVAISADFLTAFAALPRQIQGKVTEFINKFRNNPQSILSLRESTMRRSMAVWIKKSGLYGSMIPTVGLL